MKNLYFLLIFSFLFYSCSSISLREGLNINEKFDWLQIGRNERKNNISDSDFILKPPFEELWKFNADAAFERNSLSLCDGVLFASCLNGDIFAIDVKNGSGIGKVNTKNKSSNTTPLIMKDIITVTFGSGQKNYIAGYDFITGEYKWKKLTGETLNSPISKDSKIFYSSTKGNIYKIDDESGRNIWIYKNKFPFQSSPAICNGILLNGDIKGNLLAVDVSGGNLKWNYKTEGGIYSDVSIYRNKIFFGSDDKFYYCLDTNGTVIWKKNLDTKFLSSSTFYLDNVLCTGINGKIFSLNINTGEVVWEFETKGTITASPVLNGDKVYIGSFDRYFYCLDANKGDVIWKYEFDERIRTSAVIWKKYLLIACDDKSIYCFK
ncbi:MAG: PQQ-binding-like beta-propeller repeat protein [Ignavibacteria bacterium]